MTREARTTSTDVILVRACAIAAAIVATCVTHGVGAKSKASADVKVTGALEENRNGPAVVLRAETLLVDRASYEVAAFVRSNGLQFEERCSSEDSDRQPHIKGPKDSDLNCELDRKRDQLIATFRKRGLQDGSQVEWRIEIREDGQLLTVASGSFFADQEPPPDPDPTASRVKLIAVANTGNGSIGQALVAQAMSAHCLRVGGCTAVLIAGGIVLPSGVSAANDALWQSNFEIPYSEPGFANLPFYAAPGISDYGVLLPDTGSIQAMLDYADLPVGNGAPGTRVSDKFRMPARYYDVEIGADLVHLFAIDVQDTVGGSPSDQLGDMRERVADSNAMWKISFGGLPRFTSGSLQAALPLLNSQLPAPGLYALQSGIYCGTDLYIAGGDRTREFIDKGADVECPGTHFAISGAASSVVASPAVPVPGRLFFDDTTLGFAYLDITPASMLLEFYDVEGNLSFSKTITK